MGATVPAWARAQAALRQAELNELEARARGLAAPRRGTPQTSVQRPKRRVCESALHTLQCPKGHVSETAVHGSEIYEPLLEGEHVDPVLRAAAQLKPRCQACTKRPVHVSCKPYCRTCKNEMEQL